MPKAKEETAAVKKTFKIITAPEGQPTFIDPTSGAERPYIRIHQVRAFSEEAAKAVANEYNEGIVKQYGGDMYEIMSVEVEGEE